MSEPAERLPVEQLLEWVGHPNIAEELDELTLAKIGYQCRVGFEEDEATMKDWLDSVDEGLKLAKQVYEYKSDPWPGAASVKLPTISIATLHFAAGAYSELIRDGDVAQVHLPGMSPMAQAIQAETPEEAEQIAGAMGVQMRERADRVKKYMNWQLMEEIEEWEPNMDMLLHVLPPVGCVHKKTVYNPLLGRTETSLCDVKSIVINQGAKSLKRAPRVSERLPIMSENDVYERKMMGLFRDVDYFQEGDTQDGREYEFIEQHRRYDLDGDGYEEPYIVTCEARTWKVARIVARYEENDILINQQRQVVRIEPINHYSKYEFIPDFEGGYWSLGWAHLYGPLGHSQNTLVNQLLDAGTLANSRPSFVSQMVKFQEGGQLRFKMGEYKRVKAPGMKLADSFYTPPIAEPSQVLFALLGFLTDMGKELTSITDAAIGDVPPNAQATTVLAMIEQGQKVHNSIHKRVYRALRGELQKVYRLNRVYLDPNEYQRLLNVPADPQQDFADDLDVIPVASPELSSKQQRRAQAEAMRYLAYDPAGMPVPGVDVQAVARFAFAQITDDIEQFFPEPSEEDQAAQMKRMEADDIMLTETVKQAMATTKKLETEVQKNRADVVVKGADAKYKAAQTVQTLVEAQAQDIENDAVESGVARLLDGEA